MFFHALRKNTTQQYLNDKLLIKIAIRINVLENINICHI
jgi:hypothetical protein